VCCRVSAGPQLPEFYVYSEAEPGELNPAEEWCILCSSRLLYCLQCNAVLQGAGCSPNSKQASVLLTSAERESSELALDA
jgi:hypothetical protein